jgi:hypothetical protein
MNRVSQRPDKGATNDIRRRATQTGIEAVKSRLFKIRYEYLVINDPDGSGFLVYAMPMPTKPGEVVLGGNFRVTVSADGSKAERFDAWSAPCCRRLNREEEWKARSLCSYRCRRS